MAGSQIPRFQVHWLSEWGESAMYLRGTAIYRGPGRHMGLKDSVLSSFLSFTALELYVP